MRRCGVASRKPVQAEEFASPQGVAGDPGDVGVGPTEVYDDMPNGLSFMSNYTVSLACSCREASIPRADDFPAVSRIHQLEAFLEVIDVDLVREHFLQRETG